MCHVFIIGSKSIGQYGGFETFVQKLTEQHKDDTSLKYHIACKANGSGAMDESKLKGVKITKKNIDGSVAEFTYNNSHVFKVRCPQIGSAVAVYYDLKALEYSIEYCKKNAIEHPIFYILTCRIGLFINPMVKKIKKIGGTYIVNPDGHEWMRARWNRTIRAYWKWSEKKMVYKADIVVCDSINIEEYIKKTYQHNRVKYISYGSDTAPSKLSDGDKKYLNWLKEKKIKPGEYYLAVGRFVPENNYETMIREYMSSKTSRDFAIITNNNSHFYEQLERKMNFSSDPRIKFVGTVYDSELLKKIRENAFGYIHGHEVGGTNPSLLEAMGTTDLNLLLDVGFNREVGVDTALYWTKEKGSLSGVIDIADNMDESQRDKYAQEAKARIVAAYSWKYISEEYKTLWWNIMGWKNNIKE